MTTAIASPDDDSLLPKGSVARLDALLAQAHPAAQPTLRALAAAVQGMLQHALEEPGDDV